MKLRIKNLRTLIKSETDEETLLTLRSNLKELNIQKKELYPARPKEIEFAKAYSKKKNAERLRENKAVINDARALADACRRGDRNYIAAAGLNADEAKPIFSEPEKRQKDIDNLYEAIKKWDGKDLKATDINSRQKRIADYEHWEKVADALITCRKIKNSAELELKSVLNDYNNREIIMKGLNQELEIARKLKDKELSKCVRLNIKSMKGLALKVERLQFILKKMPVNIQYHRKLTAQINNLKRYLSEMNWKKMAKAYEHYDFRQDDSRKENAKKRASGKDTRKVSKYAGTNLRARDVDPATMKVEDAALAAAYI